MDMNEYLEMFLEESEEHIRQMGDKMLEFEKAPQNIDIVVVMFRSAHTLKGMAGSMGYERMQKLTHFIENLMDEIRNETVVPNEKTIDFMFNGIARLEQLLEEIREYNMEISEIDDLINTLESAQEVIQEQVEEKVEFQVNSDEKVMIEGALETGKNVFNVVFKLNEDCMLTSVRTRMFFMKLVEVAEVIKCVEEEEFDNGVFNGTVHLIIATSSSNVEIEGLVNVLSEVEYITTADWVDNGVVVDAPVVEVVVPVKDEPQFIVGENYETEDVVKEKIEIEEKSEAIRDPIETEAPIQELKKTETEAVKVQPNADENNKGSDAKKHIAIRVNLEKIDSLMAQLEEFIVEKGRLENISARFKDKELMESVDKLSRSMTEMQNSLLSMRMVPLDTIFNRYPRMVRATSKELGKNIEFVVEGAETELDRTVVDELSDPLIHLIRNSLDHGIEMPDVRTAKGKGKVGTIALKAYHRGNEAIIEISDDGNGIDAEKLKRKMVEKGTKTQDEVNLMSDEEAINSIFSSGFSTAEQVTNLSGRGVGLDVVKTKIESLGGSVKIETSVGEGSKFIIVLPLTLSIIQSLIVEDCGNIFAVPISNVVETIILKDGYIQELMNTKALYYRGQVFKVKRFATLFKNLRDKTVPAYCLLIQTSEGQFGLLVDDIKGQKEIVLKPLEGYLKVAKGVTGATVMGDGNIAFVMDVNYLHKNGGDVSEDI